IDGMRARSTHARGRSLEAYRPYPEVAPQAEPPQDDLRLRRRSCGLDSPFEAASRRLEARGQQLQTNRVSPIVVVLNGPNLNLLGKREPEIYGRETLADIEADCRRVGEELGVAIELHQSNREYELIDWIHGARERAAGIVINPAAFTHTSVAIRDALS